MSKKRKFKSKNTGYLSSTGYVNKPQSLERYRKNKLSSSQLERKYLSKIRKEHQKKYAKQQAEIKSGIKESRGMAYAKGLITPSERIKKTFTKVIHKRIKVPHISSRFKKRMTVRFAPPTENSSYTQGRYLNNPSDKPMLGWS